MLLIYKVFEFNKCKYLQLEKTSDFEIEKPIQKTLAINLLKGIDKKSHIRFFFFAL